MPTAPFLQCGDDGPLERLGGEGKMAGRNFWFSVEHGPNLMEDPAVVALLHSSRSTACRLASMASDVGRGSKALDGCLPSTDEVVNSMAALFGKCRNTVQRLTSAASAIWSTVVSAYPWLTNRSSAASAMRARVCLVLRSRSDVSAMQRGMVLAFRPGRSSVMRTDQLFGMLGKLPATPQPAQCRWVDLLLFGQSRTGVRMHRRAASEAALLWLGWGSKSRAPG